MYLNHVQQELESHWRLVSALLRAAYFTSIHYVNVGLMQFPLSFGKSMKTYFIFLLSCSLTILPIILVFQSCRVGWDYLEVLGKKEPQWDSDHPTVQHQDSVFGYPSLLAKRHTEVWKILSSGELVTHSRKHLWMLVNSGMGHGACPAEPLRCEKHEEQ